MPSKFQEPIFVVLLLIASGGALAAYMLGVFLDPGPSIAVSVVLISIGVAFFVPEEERVISAVLGLLAVGIAGVGIPRLVVEFLSVQDEMGVTLALSGIVLLLTIIALRLTVFRPQPVRSSS